MNEYIKSITSVSTPFGDGQRVTALALEYAAAVKNAALCPEQFSVPGRRIVGVYANTECAECDEGRDGHFVIIALDEKESAGLTVTDLQGNPKGAGHGPRPERPAGERPSGPPLSVMPDGRTYHGPYGKNTMRGPIHAAVKQLTSVALSGGGSVPAWETEEYSDREINKLSDLFTLGEFEGMGYALYVPENYDSTKKYPLLLFIHDAGLMGESPRITLEQGLGATIWATPEEQAKHPCFILAPQHNEPYPIANDDYWVTDELETIKRMCDELQRRYSIDEKRIYTTGQSMGCMCSFELMALYPDYFAAALPVAGHWDRPRTAVLWRQNIWFFVSDEDTKGTAMFVLPELVRELGGDMGVYRWSADQSVEALSALAAEAAKDGHSFRMTIFPDDTIWRRSQSDRTNGGGHSGTWHLVYRIEAARDWLFAQSL